MASKKPRKRVPYKRISKEDEMLHRLYVALGGLVATTLIVIIGLSFFGPQIGSFFLLLSKDRKNSGPEDFIPPPAPIFSQVPESTNKESINLNGITEPGATVELFVNGPKKEETTADNDGFFTFIEIKMGKGNNILFAKATDQNGNESDKSKVYTITFDEKPPEIKITKPINGETIKNLNSRVLVQGTLNEPADVLINGRQAVVRSDNSYELLLGVNEGDVQIKIEATDKAKNKSEEVIYIKYEKS